MEFLHNITATMARWLGIEQRAAGALLVFSSLLLLIACRSLWVRYHYRLRAAETVRSSETTLAFTQHDPSRRHQILADGQAFDLDRSAPDAAVVTRPSLWPGQRWGLIAAVLLIVLAVVIYYVTADHPFSSASRATTTDQQQETPVAPTPKPADNNNQPPATREKACEQFPGLC